jgi:hypothetical protein
MGRKKSHAQSENIFFSAGFLHEESVPMPAVSLHPSSDWLACFLGWWADITCMAHPTPGDDLEKDSGAGTMRDIGLALCSLSLSEARVAKSGAG